MPGERHQDSSLEASKPSHPSPEERVCDGLEKPPGYKWCPVLWTPSDRAGLNGFLERRRMMRTRLKVTISLTPEQVREIFLFAYNHEGRMGVNWTDEILYTYVPRTFEGATVATSTAEGIMNEILMFKAAKWITNVHSVTPGRVENGHYIYRFKWDGEEPGIPDALRDLPNLELVKEPPLRERIKPDIGNGAKCFFTPGISQLTG